MRILGREWRLSGLGRWPTQGTGQGLGPWALSAGAFIAGGKILGAWGKQWVAGWRVLSEKG